MVTIDLTTPPPPPTSFIDAMARRLALTLPELRLVAELAGGAPLPFDLPGGVDEAVDAGSLSGRLGQSRGSVEDSAYSDALRTLHDPEDTLRRRGLLTDAGADPGVVGAVGLLATPRLALDIDVAAGATQVKAWHRQAGGAVASLSTCDGIVFELAWFPVDLWTTELARVTAPPEDLPIGPTHVPAHLDVPTPSPTRSGRRCAPVAPTWCRCWSTSPPAGWCSPTVARSAAPRPPTPCRPCTP